MFLTHSHITSFLIELQESMIQTFESLEPTHRFSSTDWNYEQGEGGGRMRILRGDVFEKAAVNFSAVSGTQFPLKESTGPFFATGVSLITHMHHPHAPTAHMNVRYIETSDKSWFGGGYDLTPMGFPYPEDTQEFHQAAKTALDPFGEALYPLFSRQAQEYFYIPHRKKERGVGGIFFDHFSSGNLEHDWNMWKAVGQSFIHAIMPIYLKRTQGPFSRQDKQLQLQLRAHYVEFNFLYDRGTRFGFQSGGNPDAILCSMPPLVSW
jgi:coproporphyrinogen III oxidase